MDERTALLNVFEDLEVDVGGIDDSSRLREDLEMDSTELVELAVAVERRLGTKIDGEQLQTLGTFGDLLHVVRSDPAPAV